MQSGCDKLLNCLIKYLLEAAKGIFMDTRLSCLHGPEEERMLKFGLIGAVAVFSSVLAGPVMARQLISRPAQSIFCATREAGNPHTKYCDYLAWSKWRQRGGWDSSLDNACLQDPGFIPAECGGFSQPGQVSFGAHH
jgi:hypothetical protein